MSEPKWSTGPWIVDVERGGELPEDDIRIRTADWEIAWVKADCGELQGDQSETRANAYLISAAPDLYEALALLMSEEGVDDACYCDSDTSFRCPTCKARAALKKARGEA